MDKQGGCYFFPSHEGLKQGTIYLCKGSYWRKIERPRCPNTVAREDANAIHVPTVSQHCVWLSLNT